MSNINKISLGGEVFNIGSGGASTTTKASTTSVIDVTTDNKIAEVVKIGSKSNKSKNLLNTTLYVPYGIESRPIVEVKSSTANLFDKNSVISGKGFNGYAEADSSAWFISNYISVSNGEYWSNINIGGLRVYSANKEIINSSLTITATPDGNAFKYTISNSNVAYVRFNWKLAEINSIMFNKISATLTFREHALDSYAIPTDSRAELIAKGYGEGINADVQNTIEYGKVYHNMNSVDLGSLTWQSGYGGFYSSSVSNIKYAQSVGDVTNMICRKYGVTSYSAKTDKSICAWQGGNCILVTDSSYSDINTFKTAMSGVILHYESTSGGTDYEATIYTKMCNEVDLYKLNWEYDSSRTRFNGRNVADIKAVDGLQNVLCSKYQKYSGTIEDGIYYTNASKNVVIYDSSYTDATAFKTMLQNENVKLIYELATPHIYDVTDILPSSNLLEIEKGGTITLIDSDGNEKDVSSTLKLLSTDDSCVAIVKDNRRLETKLNNYLDSL